MGAFIRSALRRLATIAMAVGVLLFVARLARVIVLQTRR